MRCPRTLHALLALPALAFVACGGGSGTQTPPPAPPVVSGFTASTSRIVQGDSTTLTATFTGGSAVLTPGGQALQSGVPVAVSPVATTTYTVTVTGAGGTASATAKVGVEAFTAVGAMGTPRLWATATLLPSGKVLVAGGHNGTEGLATAELYDPATRTFSPAGAMAAPRYQHTAVLLPNGKVLLAGGGNATCELFDPASSTFTSSATLALDRFGLSGTLLKDGRVLLAFGARWPAGKPALEGEYFDPATGVLSPAMPGFRRGMIWHSAVALPEGGAVLVGGYDGDYPVRLNADGSVTDYAKLIRLPSTRGAQAFLKADGRLLVPGGGSWGRPNQAVTSIDLPATTATVASLLAPRRTGYGATSMVPGEALLAGGVDGVAVLDSAVVLDLATGQTRPTARMQAPRNCGLAVKLADGKVLVLGGTVLLSTDSEVEDLRPLSRTVPGSADILATAELFDPGN